MTSYIDFLSTDDTTIPCGPNIGLQRRLQLQDEELECHCLSSDENVVGIAGRSVHLFNPQLNSIILKEIDLNFVPKSMTIVSHDDSQLNKVRKSQQHMLIIVKFKAYLWSLYVMHFSITFDDFDR